MYTLFCTTPLRKAVLTSNCLNDKLNSLATDNRVQIVAIFATGV